MSSTTCVNLGWIHFRWHRGTRFHQLSCSMSYWMHQPTHVSELDKGENNKHLGARLNLIEMMIMLMLRLKQVWNRLSLFILLLVGELLSTCHLDCIFWILKLYLSYSSSQTFSSHIFLSENNSRDQKGVDKILFPMNITSQYFQVKS